MELALSLGDSAKPFTFLDPEKKNTVDKDLGFCTGLGPLVDKKPPISEEERSGSSSDPPVQLDLLPLSPVQRNQPPSQRRLPWLTETLFSQPVTSTGPGWGVGVNRPPLAAANGEDGVAAAAPSLRGAVSSLKMEMLKYRTGRGKRDGEPNIYTEVEMDQRGASSSRASDEEESGLTRKKLRLSKEQSAFLEESFKEHNTLNPKQKLALAKQLNLRPRQVEVWFQNRRARTKLKQTEVDCEYLKRCCETLTEENRRLQKELQELRALKASQPFYRQLPATTLTMCPSCERIASTTTTTPTTNSAASSAATKYTSVSLAKPKPPLFTVQAQAQQAGL
ncbi:hypothetical protein NMG60_11003797 [Bertholletia excelsa]